MDGLIQVRLREDPLGVLVLEHSDYRCPGLNASQGWPQEEEPHLWEFDAPAGKSTCAICGATGSWGSWMLGLRRLPEVRFANDFRIERIRPVDQSYRTTLECSSKVWAPFASLDRSLEEASVAANRRLAAAASLPWGLSFFRVIDVQSLPGDRVRLGFYVKQRLVLALKCRFAPVGSDTEALLLGLGARAA